MPTYCQQGFHSPMSTSCRVCWRLTLHTSCCIMCRAVTPAKSTTLFLAVTRPRGGGGRFSCGTFVFCLPDSVFSATLFVIVLKICWTHSWAGFSGGSRQNEGLWSSSPVGSWHSFCKHGHCWGSGIELSAVQQCLTQLDSLTRAL